MSKPLEEYTVRRARTLDGLKEKAQFPSNRPAKSRCGVINAPLLNIEPHYVVVDELHLILRITDVLIRNLISKLVIQEVELKVLGQPAQNYLQMLEMAVRETGVTFRVWEKRSADGKPSGKYDYTSLMGNDKKILRNLPSHFGSFILDTEVATTMSNIWIVSYTPQ